MRLAASALGHCVWDECGIGVCVCICSDRAGYTSALAGCTTWSKLGLCAAMFSARVRKTLHPARGTSATFAGVRNFADVPGNFGEMVNPFQGNSAEVSSPGNFNEIPPQFPPSGSLLCSYNFRYVASQNAPIYYFLVAI